MDFRTHIATYFREAHDALDLVEHDAVDATVQRLVTALHKEQDIYIIGNGGSAAAAAHLAVDLNFGASHGFARKFRARALVEEIPTLTCFANDTGYEEIFVGPLRNLLREHDVVIAFSGSGNSENVIRAVQYAKGLGATVIGICAFDGGKLKDLSDIALYLPMHDMQHAEDIHPVLGHCIMRCLRRYQKDTDPGSSSSED